MVNTVVESQVEVEAKTLCDKLSEGESMVDTLADLRKQWSTRWLSRKQRWSRNARRHIEICVATGRHAGRLPQAEEDTLAESKAYVEAEALGDTVSDAQPPVDTLADLGKHWSTRFLNL